MGRVIDVPGQLAHGQQRVDVAQGSSALAHAPVQFGAKLAQFKHITQDGHAERRVGLGQHFQRRPHGLGVGVVGVVQNGHVALTDHVHPHLGGDEGLHALLHLLAGHAKFFADGAGHENGIDHVVAQGGDGHGELGLGGLDLALQPLGPHLPDLFGLIGRLVVRAAPEDAGGDLPLQRPQQGVIPVEDGQVVAGHGLEDLALGLQDPLPAAQVLDVGVADVGDDRHVGGDDTGQVVDLAEVVHAHLQHAQLMLGVQAEEGQGQADLVVVVALGLQDPELLAQDRGDHVLGRGLAHAAGDADDRDGELGLIGPGHLAQGLHRVLHQNIELPRHRLLRGHGGQAAQGAAL